jgi:hypothetical protein
MEAVNKMIITQNSNNKISGVYEIVNTINGHRYVGSSCDIKNRWREHVRDLNNNKHHSAYLQRAWNKYGEKYFIFSIIKECFPFILVSLEQGYINKSKPEYNISPTAGSPLGVKHSDETKEKVSKAGKGRVFSDEHKKRISDANKGKILSDETKRRIGAKSIGRFFSEESRKKMSEKRKGISPGNKGKHHTQEARKKISNSLLGNKNTLGVEPWNKGKKGLQKMSDEARRKISESRTGKCLSIEAKRKVSEAKKKWWEEKKRANS